MYCRKKTAQKISKMQTLRDPKPAHLQWAQDQGDLWNLYETYMFSQMEVVFFLENLFQLLDLWILYESHIMRPICFPRWGSSFFSKFVPTFRPMKPIFPRWGSPTSSLSSLLFLLVVSSQVYNSQLSTFWSEVLQFSTFYFLVRSTGYSVHS